MNVRKKPKKLLRLKNENHNAKEQGQRNIKGKKLSDNNEGNKRLIKYTNQRMGALPKPRTEPKHLDPHEGFKQTSRKKKHSETERRERVA